MIINSNKKKLDSKLKVKLKPNKKIEHFFEKV